MQHYSYIFLQQWAFFDHSIHFHNISKYALCLRAVYGGNVLKVFENLAKLQQGWK